MSFQRRNLRSFEWNMVSDRVGRGGGRNGKGREGKGKEYSHIAAICSPLVFGMKYTKEKLIEFVEMNKLLGVQKISLYIDYPSVRRELIDAIKFYERQG